ncbi:ParA family protein [Paenarthrobacter sp. Z7-10]|uniref:ParA family protein n=1 Tax=Paenarthrobacter sp. Z7-10 TaxID=2787635 RepID=UPI0022A9BAF2|nr:ParA family protein [Paenarthrobacter sp. Z7-10]MCZ2402335.1 ParA family protein [Paenarthrobacter sp. Z7-10]
MQVVSISSLKGGVGKTSVTMGLASAALAAGIPTLVVDLDPHADVTTGLRVRANGELDIGRMIKDPRRTDLMANVVSSGWVGKNPADGGRRRVLDVAVGSAYAGIYDRPDLGRRDLRRLGVVLNGPGAKMSRPSGTKSGSETSDYALVLIDCPPSLNGLTRMAWTASNRVLLVAEPALFSVAGTQRTMRALELFRSEFAPGLAAAGIVANRVRSDSTEHTYRLAEMKSMFGPLLLSPVIPEQANWQQIQGAAHPIHSWPGDSARTAATMFDDLLAGLLRQGTLRNRFRR